MKSLLKTNYYTVLNQNIRLVEGDIVIFEGGYSILVDRINEFGSIYYTAHNSGFKNSVQANREFATIVSVNGRSVI